MKDSKLLFLTTALAGLPVIGIYGGQWYQREYGRIPEKRMTFDGRDFKDGALVKWPKKGVATIFCPEFTIAFEGVSWSEMSLMRSGYQVDGRYGGLFAAPDEPDTTDMGNGVTYGYAPHTREANIRFKNHRFTYCDYQNTLKVGGKTYSTAGEPIHLWVSQQGEIKQVAS